MRPTEEAPTDHVPRGSTRAEESGFQAAPVYREVVIKDGEFVRPISVESGERSAAG